MKRSFLKSSHRASKTSRLVAKIIDLSIVFIVSILLYPLGLMLSIAYLCVSDYIQGGQSVGKKFMGFFVISLENHKPCSLKQSVIRNLPVIVPLFFAVIPIWGWFFAVVLGIPLIAFEVYLVFTLDSGNRLGDVMADTCVVENIHLGNLSHRKRGFRRKEDNHHF